MSIFFGNFNHMIETHVTSLELSIKLSAFGVNKNTYFYWHNTDSFPSIITCYTRLQRSGDFLVPAFIASELGFLIPHTLPADTASKSDSKIDIFKFDDDRWCISYFSNFNLPPLIAIIADTLPNAMAKMLIWIYENGYIKND